MSKKKKNTYVSQNEKTGYSAVYTIGIPTVLKIMTCGFGEEKSRMSIKILPLESSIVSSGFFKKEIS